MKLVPPIYKYRDESELFDSWQILRITAICGCFWEVATHISGETVDGGAVCDKHRDLYERSSNDQIIIFYLVKDHFARRFLNKWDLNWT